MPATKEELLKFLETAEGKEVIKPLINKGIDEGINSWRKNTLPGVLETEIAKRHPGETEEAKIIRKQAKVISDLNNSVLKKSLESIASQDLAAGKLPTDIADLCVGTDVESTKANVARMVSLWAPGIDSAVNSRLGEESGREVVNNTIDMTTIDTQIEAADKAGNWKESLRLGLLKDEKKK